MGEASTAVSQVSALDAGPMERVERGSQGTWLLHHRADRRQVAIVTSYVGMLAGMFFVPAMRHPLCFLFACWLSFLNACLLYTSSDGPPPTPAPLAPPVGAE